MKKKSLRRRPGSFLLIFFLTASSAGLLFFRDLPGFFKKKAELSSKIRNRTLLFDEKSCFAAGRSGGLFSWIIKGGKRRLDQERDFIKKGFSGKFLVKEEKGGLSVSYRKINLLEVKFLQVGLVAVLLDDAGNSRKDIERFMNLEIPLTFSILPNERYTSELDSFINSRGYEVFLHQPMEPRSYPKEDPGKGSLFVGMKEDEIERIVEKNLSRVPHARGVNNHMGSRFTEWSPGMKSFLKILKKEKLVFIDSYTSPRTRGYALAVELGLPAWKNQYFLDNIAEKEAVRKVLSRVREHAEREGFAAVIGHTHRRATYEALKEEKELFLKSGTQFVFMSELLEETEEEEKR
ncbi:MAG TPA: divergent polysaccharide deacetylase family protein [bacterium]|nr:divergent polysaccharide deacetylase family protein [bacterium]